jgi:hypothetical protein
LFAKWLAMPAVLALMVSGRSAGASVVDVTSPTTNWTSITYANNNADPSNDQQTGSEEGDIVGNTTHPAAYTQYGDNGSSSPTAGDLAFRIRVGADASPPGFKSAMFVGIDANHDGAIDLFVGVNNSGSADTIAIWKPGAGLNISPNTTTIASTPVMSYTPIASSNYHWAPVTSTLDPTVGTATDIDGGGQNDYFLSFKIPFNDIVTQLSAQGINGVTRSSTFSYIIATATQANSLNQDINGIGQTFDGSATWSSLGAIANDLTADGMSVVPEFSPFGAVTVLAVLAVAHDVWRRKKTRARSESASA